ncbi:MAG: RNA-binding domain-containing protein [Candidatus Thorarchaeota archaeon]|jgi:predicted RNA binding protein with dsRBD fold (UPF0201 family)
MMEIEVTCYVHPTEDPLLVEKALSNTFVGVSPEYEENETTTVLRIVTQGKESINWLRNRIHELRIIDVVRKRLTANWNEAETHLSLDKQAGSQGRLRFIDESNESPPLGCIQAVMRFKSGEEFELFLSWFTPTTQNGRIVKG